MNLVKLSPESIEKRIFLIRGHRVMVDRDLAAMYGVPVKRLNEQVRRNIKRFPEDFMFRLTKEEAGELVTKCDRFKEESLRSQNATLKGRGKHIKYLPYAFTEHGTLMLANVLKSEKAIEASIQIVRTFMRMRTMLVGHKDLTRKINALERKYDGQFRVVFDAIKQLMQPAGKTKRKIGY